MDLSRPYSAVSPGLQGEILVTLARTTRALTGRQIARLVLRGSQTGVNRALRRLAGHGLVRRELAGRAALYELNRDHVAADAVVEMAAMREKLIDRVRARVGTWNVLPAHVSIFGSFARADGAADSDIDVFVVRRRGVGEDASIWRRQIDELARSISAWAGNPASLAEIGDEDLRNLRR